MSLTTWSRSPRGAGRRWDVGHLNFCSAAARILLVAAAIVAAGASALADGEMIGTSEFFLGSGTGHLQGPFVGSVNANNLVGAPRFYNAGFTGTNAVIANIEAGYVWTGHEALSHVTTIPASPGAAGEVDRHATWVSMVLGGRPGGANPGDHQRGMAPNAQLASGAIATNWPSSLTRYTGSFNFNFSAISTFGPYRAAFLTGVPVAGGSRTADVINSSYNGNGDLAGVNSLSGTLDALINQNPRTLLTTAVGNTLPTGEGPNRVLFPATGYNTISVAALTSNGGLYNLPSVFSNGGPNDYFDSVNGTVSAVRQVIDIAAPGESFSTAYYGGETGGNGPSLMGPANGPAGGPDFYTRSISGTSFSSPTVAGGAALLYDAAYAVLAARPDARDGRVIKSVLMNAADKTMGWDNGQIDHPNGGGGVQTTRGVDDRVGAGRLNLDRAFDQFLNGTTDVAGTVHGSLGAVKPVGWDFGEVAQGATNDYLINGTIVEGTTLTATLSWFRDRSTLGLTEYQDESFDNLDLELWSALAGGPVSLISESFSRYNNTEHFEFKVPTTGQYMLRVRWKEELFDVLGDVNAEHYGLAWSTFAVPEPTTLTLMCIILAACGLARRRG
jgi:subtilase family protein